MALFGKIFGGKQEEQAVKPKRAEKEIVCEPKTVYSPLKGKVIPLDQVEDPAFAQGIMGVGVGIEPEGDCLYAPVDGTVVTVFPTGHAVGMMSEGGMEVLMHIGIDTVQMNGEGFKTFVKDGEKVKAGDPLVRFDQGKIRKAGYKTTTMVLVSNAAGIGELCLMEPGETDVLSPLYSFR